MKRKKVRAKDLHRFFIAGAFGSYINMQSARLLGLVPDVPTTKIRSVGNTAITGARMVLISKDERRNADYVSKKVRYLELTTDPDFAEEFANAMYIPNKDLSRFPSLGNV